MALAMMTRIERMTVAVAVGVGLLCTVGLATLPGCTVTHGESDVGHVLHIRSGWEFSIGDNGSGRTRTEWKSKPELTTQPVAETE